MHPTFPRPSSEIKYSGPVTIPMEQGSAAIKLLYLVHAYFSENDKTDAETRRTYLK